MAYREKTLQGRRSANVEQAPQLPEKTQVRTPTMYARDISRKTEIPASARFGDTIRRNASDKIEQMGKNSFRVPLQHPQSDPSLEAEIKKVVRQRQIERRPKAPPSKPKRKRK